MPKFKVLRPIEHNLKLYLPVQERPGSGVRSPESEGRSPEKKPSVGHGMDIPVDASGTIELSDSEAAAMTAGQIEPIKKLKVKS